MAQSGRASLKRGKPSYFMSVLGVTLVLFLLGVLGWLGINAKKLMQYYKESIEVQVYLKNGINDRDRALLQDSIAALPAVKTVRYTDKEAAKKEWVKSGNEDFSEFLDNNLLPNSINFNLKEEFVDSTQLMNIKTRLQQNPIVDEVQYSKAVVGSMQRNFRIASLILLAIVIGVSIMVIILIDNTIRLAMFSNRFLIKTMQMVGATRGFIARPLNIRAVINGALSAAIATAVLYIVIRLLEGFFPGMNALFDTNLFLLLFLGLLVIGVSITLFSTYRSVLKYLRMKLDELY
ncbi:FtsX-like permease family protein [Flaviaesturariibacter flavus]|uniref:Cell division protein FtsX n=2 Tax=Flaviaesturariibacter flavus TaxID=2502780 RepID=A0A4R1BNE0_9BACT|nr:FtsX-like permease family protein [Flaviaesturariibacter flavus]